MEGPDRRVHQWPVEIGGVDLPTSEVKSTQELTIVGGVSVILSIQDYLLACPMPTQQISKKSYFVALKKLWVCTRPPSVPIPICTWIRSWIGKCAQKPKSARSHSPVVIQLHLHRSLPYLQEAVLPKGRISYFS